MTAASLARVVGGDRKGIEFPHVLIGAAFDGPAAALARALDRALLEEAGWDPVARILFLPVGHRLLGRKVCRVEQCTATAHYNYPDICHRCFTRLTRMGMTVDDIAARESLPAAPVPAPHCAVPKCRCVPTVPGAVLCEPHASNFRNRRIPVTVEEFVRHPRVRPHPPSPACSVPACTRTADGAIGYCGTHYQRWSVAQQNGPGLDEQSWRTRESGVAEPGQVNLRKLPELVVVEVLVGLQTRVREGLRLTDVVLRAVCDTLRRHQVASIHDCEPGLAPGLRARSVLASFARDARRALADPGGEQTQDIWDLAIFGHPGRLSFTAITQPWLADAAKRWAAEQLPHHRGSGASRVRGKINNIGLLSEHLARRPDRGLDPAALGRTDLEEFLNRLGHLEFTGRIGRYRRNMICRDVRQVLAGIRSLGLTRPRQPAAGLPGDFAIERIDIPADPERGEPGRCLPAEIMNVVCSNLDTLEPAEVRVATQIGIDTGRRPEDILNLTLNCLDRDKDGGEVLVYDNIKANRLRRRLPISTTTAAVITAQQHRVRHRFPDTPIAELRLLPTRVRNPDGRKAISTNTLAARHRDWLAALPTLRTEDGTEFDKTRVVPYAYRHSYAQRHADAGVPIDVLAELLDHRSYSMTRRYYRIGEDRRRAAVDTVTALSFDRHGNRIWRDAQMLLDSERARHAVGEVAVPYGTCTEPTNVKAGGGACPVRYRCVGCDHFRTTVAFLPELQAYLDDLLRTRERLAATIDGIDDWARADASPTEEEITRVRRLINRIKGDITGIDDTERARIDDAVAIVRRHRAAHTVPLGMPILTVTPPGLPTTPTSEASA
ncbi:transposase [Mycobacterium sp. ENV421]|uniref:tyrosine-type recombinase/integrase n=1 Tax=Mycobacterium sp. ENV421 TaxID=1213407 RepID=UPI000C9CA1C0|nr:tyrosine-type recombinase/integrase [Mycobacterium sp. ENV421]PND54154.1 transposase [Mycobacterium sp. ENV421]